MSISLSLSLPGHNMHNIELTAERPYITCTVHGEAHRAQGEALYYTILYYIILCYVKLCFIIIPY